MGNSWLNSKELAQQLALLGAAGVGAFFVLVILLLWRRVKSAQELAHLRRTLLTSADWYWQTDRNGIVRVADIGRRRLRWLDCRQLINQPLSHLLQAEADPVAVTPQTTLATESLQQAIDSRAPFFDLLIHLGCTDGDRLVALSATPLHTASGQFDGYVGVGRDLSELRQALEKALPQAAQQNTAEVEKLRAEFAARSRQHDIAAQELDSFAHSVSHDLRAPLRVVDGFATIVLEDYAQANKPLDDLGRDHMRRIIAAGSRMNLMIDTLLSLSRMTSRELEREHVDLSQYAQELADELQLDKQADKRNAASSPPHKAVFVIEPGLTADGDRTLLRLVLQNLLGNAFKFSAKAELPRIEFGARQKDGQRIYFVRDNGAGFDMRFADKLFGLFQRFHSTNEFPGTGVGLATVQRILRKHGGRIWAESSPGAGATFFFTLWEKR